MKVDPADTLPAIQRRAKRYMTRDTGLHGTVRRPHNFNRAHRDRDILLSEVDYLDRKLRVLMGKLIECAKSAAENESPFIFTDALLDAIRASKRVRRKRGLPTRSKEP